MREFGRAGHGTRHTRGMHLHPEEPEASSWEPLDDVELAVRVRALLPAEMLALVLVDGRSGSGKSTFTERLARLLDGTRGG
jgi:ABC-type multidrug transport system fused ATPase/permease subunit